MYSSKAGRQNAHGRHKRTFAELERLEQRTVLTYSPIGSLPDLTVVGSVPPVAAYSGPITVQVDVSNIGASSMVEPLALVPNSVSTADAGPSVVGVYLSTNPNRFVRSQAVRIGQIAVPYLRQNSTFELQGELQMPDSRPAGFPTSGGRLWVWFRVDDLRSVAEIDESNNVSRGAQPVELFAPLPQLAILDMNAPTFLSPGDSLEPSFKIANYGTVATAPQGPVLVQLVASTDRNYGPTDIVLASYTINNINPLSEAPSLDHTVLGDVTLDNPDNVLTIGGQVVSLPSEPNQYYIGLIADPFQTIRQITDLDGPRSSALSDVRLVGPPIHGLDAANSIGTAAPTSNIFPTPAYGLITSPYFPPSPTSTGGTTSIVGRGAVQFRTNQQHVSGSRKANGRGSQNGGSQIGRLIKIIGRSGGGSTVKL